MQKQKKGELDQWSLISTVTTKLQKNRLFAD